LPTGARAPNSCGAAGIVASGLLAAYAGDRDKARNLFLIADSLPPRFIARQVRARARDWLVLEAASKGDWQDVIRRGRRGRQSLRWSYTMAHIGERLIGEPNGCTACVLFLLVARRNPDAAHRNPAAAGTRSRQRPLARTGAMIRQRMFKDIEAQCADYAVRRQTETALPAPLEWDCWASARHCGGRLLQLDPASADALFRTVYVRSCNFAAFQINRRAHATLAYDLFEWLASRHRGDLQTRQLRADDMKISLHAGPKFRTGGRAMTWQYGVILLISVAIGALARPDLSRPRAAQPQSLSSAQAHR
jgi:hypothetical protein